VIRRRLVGEGVHEDVAVFNHGTEAVELELRVEADADFADLFEVKDALAKKGELYREERDGEIVLGYRREQFVRETRIGASAEAEIDDHGLCFRLRIAPGGRWETCLIVTPFAERECVVKYSCGATTAIPNMRQSLEQWLEEAPALECDWDPLAHIYRQSLIDLAALRFHPTVLPGQSLPAAGLPWFMTLFGRDSLITSLQALPFVPELAVTTLRVLAARQGTTVDDFRDEEPGKILHEVRRGEMAGAGMVPHTPYYGSVDSTPLFLIVYGQHLRWTGDVDFARKLLPAAEAALNWIDEYGDLDGDGFVEYKTRSARGIRNQGWKDSFDSIVHADGRLAEPPIALSEVQGYVYLAKMRMADVYTALGDERKAEWLRASAHELRKRFNEAFWMEDEKYFAGALDADKRQVRTIVSNPGHVLYCDLVDTEKAAQVAKRLLAPDMFSGWGIRTMSKAAAAYNPMSYHNGSVWPHDNALIAAGLKRYGYARSANRVATALFDAAIHADYLRLPELFCGFTRRTPNRPVSYPVACSPQAWAAGSPFLMLQAMLGISSRADLNLLTVNQPHLPTWLNTVELRNMQVGRSHISLVFRREGEITSFSMLSRDGDVRVVMEE
jgi:glycogen debranching enzyme